MPETPFKIIVANPYDSGLNVRRQPNIKSGAFVRKLSNGDIVTAYLMFPMGDQLWARLTSSESTNAEYMCMGIGDRTYARMFGNGKPPAAESWVEAVDWFLRERGYMGPRP